MEWIFKVDIKNGTAMIRYIKQHINISTLVAFIINTIKAISIR